MIPYGRQDITEEDISAVIDVLHSDFLTQGPVVPTFENLIANYCGAQYAVAVNSATSALHIACLSLELGPGDLLWTSPITFVASANCALYCNASVDFVDIDPNTYNISVDALEQKLIEAKINGSLPKILVAVHLCGQSCDMQEIQRLSAKYGFNVIEDASHAIGGRYQGQAIGDCRYSDITVFSFHPVKIITTGEGGALTTNDPMIYKKLILLRSHGVTRDSDLMMTQPDGDWYYQQVMLGFNYRMSEIHAALGVSQIARLDSCIFRRNQLAERYDHELSQLSIQLPYVHADSFSAYHLYIIRVPADIRKKLFDLLRKNDIGVNVHYIPVHTQPYYQRIFNFKQGDFPVSEKYYKEAISIPLFHKLSEDDQNKIIEIIRMVVT